MGQKTHPVGLRVGLWQRKWNNTWYSASNVYKKTFFSHYFVDKFLKNFLKYYLYTKKAHIEQALLVNTRFIKTKFNLGYLFIFFYKLRTTIKKKKKKKKYTFSWNRKSKKKTIKLNKLKKQILLQTQIVPKDNLKYIRNFDKSIVLKRKQSVSQLKKAQIFLKTNKNTSLKVNAKLNPNANTFNNKKNSEAKYPSKKQTYPGSYDNYPKQIKTVAEFNGKNKNYNKNHAWQHSDKYNSYRYIYAYKYSYKYTYYTYVPYTFNDKDKNFTSKYTSTSKYIELPKLIGEYKKSIPIITSRTKIKKNKNFRLNKRLFNASWHIFIFARANQFSRVKKKIIKKYKNIKTYKNKLYTENVTFYYSQSQTEKISYYTKTPISITSQNIYFNFAFQHIQNSLISYIPKIQHLNKNILEPNITLFFCILIKKRYLSFQYIYSYLQIYIYLKQVLKYYFVFNNLFICTNNIFIYKVKDIKKNIFFIQNTNKYLIKQNITNNIGYSSLLKNINILTINIEKDKLNKGNSYLNFNTYFLFINLNENRAISNKNLTTFKKIIAYLYIKSYILKRKVNHINNAFIQYFIQKQYIRNKYSYTKLKLLNKINKKQSLPKNYNYILYSLEENLNAVKQQKNITAQKIISLLWKRKIMLLKQGKRFMGDPYRYYRFNSRAVNWTFKRFLRKQEYLKNFRTKSKSKYSILINTIMNKITTKHINRNFNKKSIFYKNNNMRININNVPQKHIVLNKNFKKDNKYIQNINKNTNIKYTQNTNKNTHTNKLVSKQIYLKKKSNKKDIKIIWLQIKSICAKILNKFKSYSSARKAKKNTNKNIKKRTIKKQLRKKNPNKTIRNWSSLSFKKLFLFLNKKSTAQLKILHQKKILRNSSSMKKKRYKIFLMKGNSMKKKIYKKLKAVLKRNRKKNKNKKKIKWKKAIKKITSLKKIRVVFNKRYFDYKKNKDIISLFFGFPINLYYINALAVTRFEYQYNIKTNKKNLVLNRKKSSKIFIEKLERQFIRRYKFIANYLQDFTRIGLLSLYTRNYSFLMRYIAFQIEKLQKNRKETRLIQFIIKALKIFSAQRKEVLALKIQFKGRVNRWRRTKIITGKRGYIPFYSYQTNLEYATATAVTRKGALGIRFWLSYTLVYSQEKSLLHYLHYTQIKEKKAIKKTLFLQKINKK